MSKSNQRDKFLQFREQFPYFSFEKQEYSLTSVGLSVTYTFNLSGKFFFYPRLFIPRKSFFLSDEVIRDKLDSIIFNIGMIELISYWKAACSPKLIIRPYYLSPAQVQWWKKLYFHGLGEFFYLNGITPGMEDFMEVEVSSLVSLPPLKYTLMDYLIIPVGGGKDSAVTLELLGDIPGSLPLIMNPRAASLDVLRAIGSREEDLIEIRRTLDPELLRMNEQGFLNGHTPFSALLAFISVLAAILTGHRNIALSNESSANEVTLTGTNINHQYSKSFTFESDFRAYVRDWISREINYFSFLRPLNELQIAEIFSQFRHYHPVFRSCNAGSKTDSWCGECAKCLFTYIILSPYLQDTELLRIFGKNLLDDYALKPLFDQLCGLAEDKPFDCVGTVNEVNLALCEIIRQKHPGEFPALLLWYQTSPNYHRFKRVDFRQLNLIIGNEHHLTPAYEKKLKTALNA